MAQNGWDAIYSQTQTASKSWTKLSEGSTNGKVLGATDATTYYYITESLDFTNSRTDNGGDGNSGLKIQGTVYLYIPAGLHIFCKGANASGSTGAGAGIELSKGNTLYIIGGGNGAYVEAKGGNAANGSNGGTGEDATGSSSWCRLGTGGKGGDGGGGAGAGIGTCGGAGGAGGSGGSGSRHSDSDWKSYSGNNGSSGKSGSTADAMGTLNVDQTQGITVNATGGAAASSGGEGGERGRGWAYDGYSNNYTVAGGGGGGGGGFGGAASNIGTGGPGGGGGGGGAGGAMDWRPNSSGGVYDVTAYGGKGGTNANGRTAADGTEAATTGTAQDAGWVKVDNGSFGKGDWNSPSGDCSFGNGGSGGGKGNNSSNGTTNTGKLEYTITYNFVKPQIKTETVKYSPSSNTNVVLPKNREGYAWALLIYGKDCHATGNTSEFAKEETKTFFGGNYDDDAERTILLKDVYGNIEFQEVAANCKLNNMGDNSQLLNEFFYDESVKSQKYPITVRLKDRTLYKDGRWNTICLPFDLTPAQFAASPLAGATVMKMDSRNTGYYSDGVKIPDAHIDTKDPILVLWFEDAEPSTKGLQKGKPYLVKWDEGEDLVDDTKEKIHQLDFHNVTITEKVAGSWYSNGVTFKGTFSQSADLRANDVTKLFLGPWNKLYYPSKKINVGSCRGYFILPVDVEDDDDAKTRGIVIGLEGDGTTNNQTK